MTLATPDERGKNVRRMFARIARRYDVLNCLMTFGQDTAWRKEAVKHLQISGEATVLDLGTGTGDIAFEILAQNPTARVVASDFTPEMIAIGRKRQGGDRIFWVIADAQYLPFPEGQFDGVISGYLLRNVADLDRALSEQARVLNQGSYLVSLDTTPPQKNFFRPFIEFYLRYVIPVMGKWIAGDSTAYTYLPQSTERWKAAEVLADLIARAGFEKVAFNRKMMGSMAIHWGRRR